MERLKNLLYDTNVDFVGWQRTAVSVSAVMVFLSWVAFFVIGPNWGIDFTGGTEIHLQFHDDIAIEDLRGALRTLGLSDDSVQRVGSSSSQEFAIRIQDAEFGARELREQVEAKLGQSFGPTWVKSTTFSAEVGARLTILHEPGDETVKQVAAALEEISGAQVSAGSEENEIIVKLPGLARQIQTNIASALGGHDFEVLSVDAVGPKVGADLQRQGFAAIFATLVLVLVYVAFRFDLSFAPGAVLALFHDVSITVGIFTLAQIEFNLPMIGALLTIVGYSLNDTIIIYDRIRENRDRYRRRDLSELVNVSINETLARTVATSATTLFAILLFLVLGGPVIQHFALAMTIGIVFGTYSTIFIASPLVIAMEHIRPWLNGFVAKPSGEGEVEELDEEDAFIAQLSQSEQRRRERERAEKQQNAVEP